MATPRLLAGKLLGHVKFPSASPSLVRGFKLFNKNYKSARHTALYLSLDKRTHTTDPNYFSEKVMQKVMTKLEKLGYKGYTDLVPETKAVFMKSLGLLFPPKSPYNVLYSDGSNNRQSNHNPNRNDDDDQNEGGQGGQGGPFDPNNLQRISYWFLIGLFLYMMYSSFDGYPMPETSWPLFLRLMLNKGEVERLTVLSSHDTVFVYLRTGAFVNGVEALGAGPHYYFTIGDLQSFEDKLQDAQEQLGIKPNDFIPVKYDKPSSGLLSNIFQILVGVVVIGLVLMLMNGGRSGGGGGMRGMNPYSSYTKAKANVILPGSKKGVGFKDVAGMREAKEEVREFVDYLKYSSRFKELGARIPKGALLTGPPGTGKTLLAKAVSTEANVPFLSMAGSDFVEMFGGVGSARVRSLFKQARSKAPCIVYIDEVDAIGRARGGSGSGGGGGNEESENTLNQLLVEMDGMNSIDGIVMLASTNRPDILDKALMRPGRFDRQISIDLPTLPERRDIFEIYLKQLKLGESTSRYAKRLAELTPGKSGADIKNICNEAALHAARLSQNIVGEENFEYAIERVIAGLKKNSNPLSTEEKEIVAYHEAGHAIVNWMLKHTEPVLKISTIPRTNSPLGFTMKFPLDVKLHTNEQLFDMMCSLLGGRVAESLVFDRITTGAEDDLQKVTDLAYRQISVFGMSERIGLVSFPRIQPGEMTKKFYSDKLQHEIDEEVGSLVTRAKTITEELIKEHRDKLDILAQALIEKEVVNYKDIVELIGESPHGNKMDNYYSKQLDFNSDLDHKPES